MAKKNKKAKGMSKRMKLALAGLLALLAGLGLCKARGGSVETCVWPNTCAVSR